MAGWTRGLYVIALVIPAATYVIEDRLLLAEVETFERFTMPGEHKLTLEAGDYSLYMESRGRYRGGSFSGGVDQSMNCKVLLPNGEKMLLLSSTESITYDVGDFAGKLFVELEIDAAGEHLMTCSYSGAPGSAALFALGHGRLDSGKERKLRLAIASAVAIVLIIITLFIRRK